MTKLVASINSPGRLTVLAALLAGLSFPAMAAPADIVISQVYGGGGNSGSTYKNDFIELFNRSGGPVTLSGWSVQYASKTSATWAVTTIPTVTLQAGQYFLVQEAQGAGGSTVLPAPDASNTTALSASDGKVALVSSTAALSAANPSGGTLVDLVGFGAANGFEGAPTPATANPTAVLRLLGGCTDTDANNADFAVAAPTPRNTASPVNNCVAPPIVATCPSNLGVQQGKTNHAALSASDKDGIVNNAAITAGAVAGISLSSFSAAGAIGASASVNLDISPAVAVGSYPLAVTFSNDQAQNTSCTINVNVQPLPAITYSIPQIQGAGATSPHLGVQTTEGVVTAKVGTGFFLQDEQGDGDPTTSDALFVYTGATAAGVAVGDVVRVTASVTEFTPTGASRSYTEMSNPSALMVQDSGHSITPTNIELPNSNLGQFEAMLVRFSRALTVSQSEFLGSRGELTLSSGRLEGPTNRYPARSAEALALAAANAANMIVLDDGLFVTPTVIPYIGADSTIRLGDTVADLTGVLDFGAIGGGGVAFKVHPTVAPVFSRDNPRPTVASFAPGNVKVASANVLNFFTTFTDGSDVFGALLQGCKVGASTSKSNCRGADNLVEFKRQRDKIVHALTAIDADVFGLMEIQNNGETTVAYLVDSLNAAIGSTTYAVVPKPADTGTDAIRVAMIYKPGKLTLVGGALSDSDTINDRTPMAATFKAANGAKFSLIVNHMKSKGGSCPSAPNLDADTTGQGCWNNRRVLQAQRLAGSFIPLVAGVAGDPDVLVIGDLNSYGMEDPIKVLTDAGLVNQLERYVRPTGTPYSYVFDSVSGYLDHALASASLSGQVSGAGEFHNNADEPTVIDYNTDGKPQDLYVDNAYRASDHDPVLISLNLAPTFVDASASFTITRSGFSMNRITSKYSGTLSFTNKTADPISGPFQVRFDGLTSGVTLDNKTGDNGGYPYITVGNSAIAPGATVTISTTFSNPAKAGIGYTATIFSGTF
jgi:predicted extracellular nuclease